MTTPSYRQLRRDTVQYEEYLRSEAWKRKRAEALQRAGHQCQLCASARNLQAHHRTYARLGNEAPGDLTVLCERCHQWHHWRLMMIDAPTETHDPIRAVQTALRTWATAHSRARDDLAAIASAKMSALEDCRRALNALDRLDVDEAPRAWVRRALVAQIADGMRYSPEMVESMFSLAREEAAA